jgi:hypothetical protein
MRAVTRVLAGLAVAALVIGIGWAFVSRSSGDTTTPALVLVVGLIAAVDAVALFVLAERQPDGLRTAGRGLPAPMWWPPLLAAGLVALVGGIWTSALVAISGGVVVVVAVVGAVGQLIPRNRAGKPNDRRTVRTARQIVGFGRRHSVQGRSTVLAAIEPLGEDPVRLVLVAPDGAFGDLVVTDEATARAALALAGADVQDASSRELGARIRTGPYEWVRMAGSQLGGSRS